MDKNLTAFLAIVKTGNLTIAADEIGLTQPSLTKRLNNLELEIGSALFERHRRGMSLTPAGELFHQYASGMERDFLQVNEELKSLKNAGIDILRVAAGPLYHQLYLAPVFAKLREQFPKLSLDVIVETAEQSLPKLMKNELDVILGVFQLGTSQENLRIIPYTEIEHGLVIHRLELSENTTKLRPDELKDFQWVLYLDDPKSEDRLNAYFARNDIGAPNIVVRTASFATGLSLVRSAGYVMMAPTELSPVIESDELRVISTDPPISNLSTGAYIRESSKGIAAIMNFVALMEEEIQSAASA